MSPTKENSIHPFQTHSMSRSQEHSMYPAQIPLANPTDAL